MFFNDCSIPEKLYALPNWVLRADIINLRNSVFATQKGVKS